MSFDIVKSNFAWLVILLTTAVILTACRGEETAESDSTEASSSDRAITESVETVVAIVETAVPEPTPVPATETPVLIIPTETAVPPTEVPTDTPEPTVETTVSSTQTACDHPYLPIREGSTWTYEGSSGQLTWTVTSVEGDMENATAQMRANVAGIVLNYEWQCGPDGMSSFDFATLNAPVGLGLIFEPVSMTGHFLLPAEQLQLDTAWDLIMHVDASGQVAGESVSGDMIHTQNNLVVSTDSITFNGESVNGLQLERDTIIELTISASGVVRTLPPMTLNGSYSFAQGIGITEMVTTSSAGTDTLSLVYYTIP